MKQTINIHHFRDAFRAADRADQFSFNALDMLFNHFEDTAPDAELDVIAICCGYSEDSPESIADQYDIDVRGMDEGETLKAVLEYLGKKTQVIGVNAWAVVYSTEF